MQNGIILGIYGILTFAIFIAGLSSPLLSTFNMVLTLNFPVFAIFLTARFRRTVAPNFRFSFARGFTHTLLCVLYAGIWVSIATFVYFQFIDNGHMTDIFQQRINSPEFVELMKQTNYDSIIKQSSNGASLQEIIEMLRNTSAASYAGLTMYIFILSAPLISILGGLFNIRRR